MSLSAKIFIGLFLGVLAGLFLGEQAAFLKPLGDAFIHLLKMAVLPYIVVSLVSGLGRLTYREAGTLLVRVGGILVLIWVFSFVLLFLLPLSFPVRESAFFFSTSLLKEPEPFDFLQFIPDNPFYSLSNNIVPAVVLFSIAVGVALMGIERKQPLIENFDILADALTRVMKFVMRLTPLGVFAIAGSVSGTMPFKELGQLQVYLLNYVGATLFLTFCVLPLLVTIFTPVTYGALLGRIKEALVTAFATDNLLIVLPILADQGKELVRDSGLEGEEPESAVDVIVPASFNFPHAGKLLQLSFVLFAAWFTETSTSILGYLHLMISGLFSFFGKPVAAMPFLLELLRIPADMFELYLASGILVARFGTLVSVMQTFVLAVLGAFAMSGLLRFRWKPFLTATAVVVPLTFALVVGARFYFTHALENAYDKARIIKEMQLLREMPAMTVHQEPAPVSAEDLARPTLERIQNRGFIRVGYIEDILPFDYFNAAGEFVGFDVAMAGKLARELQVRVEFVPVQRGQIAAALDAGQYDVVMSAIPVTPQTAREVVFSEPYLELTFALVVADHRRDDFDTQSAMQNLRGLRIAVPDIPYYVNLVRTRFPNAQLVHVNHPREFFENRTDGYDALAFTAEMGSAWSLLYPKYTVVVPRPNVVTIPLAYPVAIGDRAWAAFLSAWVDLKKKDGTIKELYDYWILGKNAGEKRPRWSVIRNVLHWVE